jgi:peptide/nickel transport system permease protein
MCVGVWRKQRGVTMLRFILRRALLAVAGFIGVTFVIWYFGVHLASNTLASQTPSYLTWITGYAQGDWGSDTIITFGPTGTAIQQIQLLPEFQSALLPTLLIILPAFILQEICAFGSGVIASVRANGSRDRMITSIVSLLTAMPAFLIGEVLILSFAVFAHWLPGDGLVNEHISGEPYGTAAYWVFFHAHLQLAVTDLAQHLILPIVVLTLATFPLDGQMIRIAMLEVLGQDYIRAARAHGVPQQRLIWGHALRNALLPILTHLGTQIPRLLFVDAVIEYVFNIPGIGNLFAQAVVRFPAETLNGSIVVNARDLAPVLDCMVMFVALTVIASAITDLLYAVADPRVRLQGKV